MKIDIDDLKVGTILEKNIERQDGTLILNKGTLLTQGIIERLKKMNGIRCSESELLEIEEVDETVELELRDDTENALKEFLDNPSVSNMEKIEENTKKIVEAIENSEDPQYDLEMYLQKVNDISCHSVRVACFSILLAKMYNDSLKIIGGNRLIDLNDIALAAVLQDIGKIYKEDNEKLERLEKVPNIDVIEKICPGIKDLPLDKYDENYSSVYSYCVVGGMENVNSATKLMLLFSGEPENGDGCLKVPTQVTKKRNDFIYGAKIIRVCNVYDNAMQQAINNNNSLEEVVSELGYDARNGIINDEIQNLLINKVKLYPVKTRVRLSNGEIAVVKQSRVGQQDSYKPVVCTRPYPGRMIDLKETTNITIQSIVSKELFKKLVKQQIEDMKYSAKSGKKAEGIEI